MNYHIGRMLIDENFDDRDICPMCRIKSTVEKRLAEQYLGEAVMEDETRNEVNQLGFCARHFDILYKMQSKLGLALQTKTRLKTLYKSINSKFSPKNAKKQAEKIDRITSGCVICKYLSEHMLRYYKTVAEVYYSDEKFRGTLSLVKGFCLNHYARLLEYSAYAKSKTENYINSLIAIENECFSETEKKLDEFCDRHDYRNSSKPLGDAKTALPDARKMIYETDFN